MSSSQSKVWRADEMTSLCSTGRAIPTQRNDSKGKGEEDCSVPRRRDCRGSHCEGRREQHIQVVERATPFYAYLDMRIWTRDSGLGDRLEWGGAARMGSGELPRPKFDCRPVAPCSRPELFSTVTRSQMRGSPATRLLPVLAAVSGREGSYQIDQITATNTQFISLPCPDPSLCRPELCFVQWRHFVLGLTA